MKCFEYPAVRVKQSINGQYVVLFGAPAIEIEQWGGVPQKKELGDAHSETTGFQREENAKRLASLREFYANPANTVQNPLLVAPRTPDGQDVTFVVTQTFEEGLAETGVLKISVPDFSKFTLLELLQRLKSVLEQRVPNLKDRVIPDSLVISLKRKANDAGHEIEDLGDDILDLGENGDESTDIDASPESALLADESHILEFYDEVAARVRVVGEIPGFSHNEFLGFDREAIISFLKPTIIVDGQHRLGGALSQAKEALRCEPFASRVIHEIGSGRDPKEVEDTLLREVSRRLPVSLLLNSDPAEHVFQFVIVNQKATPIGRALLGTIVATTLSNDELARVSERLSSAGILLEEARHVAFLSRDPSSPFYGLVEKGLKSDKNTLLPFSVMVSIVKVFRDLKGGKLWHEPNDFADIWRRQLLKDSPVVADWESKGFATPFEYWRSDIGPWRKVFIEFWKAVANKLASDDPDSHNFWGNPRVSNIFNKIYLHILAADFFQFLADKELELTDPTAVKSLVDKWLIDVKESYFDRDWKMEGQKKDVPGIRKQWSTLWVNYRKSRGGRAPSVNEFKQAIS